MRLRPDRAVRALLPVLLATGALAFELWGAAPVGFGGPVTLRALAALVVVLGWRLQRGRAIWAAAVILGLAEARRLGFPAGEPVLGELLGSLAVLGLGLATWWVEAPLASRRTALRLGALLGVAGLARLLAQPELDGLVVALGALGEETRAAVAGWLPGPGTTVGRPLPGGAPLATAALVGGCGLGLAGWAVRRRGVDGGLFAAALLLAGAEVGAGPGAVGSPGWLASAALLILAVAIVEGAALLAFEDPLTGLPGRRALDERLERLGGDYCLAMVDLDHFKKLNDRWGHEVGDQVLELVASRLAKIGAGGEAFRYGGEEMTIVFDRCEPERAEEALEEMRREIAEHPFRQRSAPRKGGARSGPGRRIPVTVSIGLAASDGGGGPRAVLKAADQALYRAKRAGRDRVVRAGKRRRR